MPAIRRIAREARAEPYRAARAVLEANLSLVRDGLVVETFGNASGIDRAAGSSSSNRAASITAN